MLLPRLAHRLLALFKRGEQLRVGRRVERRQGVALQTAVRPTCRVIPPSSTMPMANNRM
jgi:hypothetical protein